MNKSKEYMKFLKKELKEYEAETFMTEDERSALHEWVDAGNRVHENGSMAYYEGGRPMDFLDVYREEEEIRKTLDRLEGKEREKYLRRLRGEMNAEDLREGLYHYSFVCDVYEYVLRKHGLLSEAKREIMAAKKRSEEFIRACEEANEGIEVTFSEEICI